MSEKAKSSTTPALASWLGGREALLLRHIRKGLALDGGREIAVAIFCKVRDTREPV